jgi:prepilin-type N-terminal cleavage/methylation domain-containing protein
MKLKQRGFSPQGAFTLIELLIVIAILGVLAVVVLLALNPVQQLARTRDSGRISAVTQLGHALEAYATSNNGNYVTENLTWITTLVNAGEIATVPAAITYSIPNTGNCGTNQQNGICYNAQTAAGGAPIVVYARLEGAANNSRCPANQQAHAVYSTADGRGGIVCRAAGNEPAPGNQTFLP